MLPTSRSRSWVSTHQRLVCATYAPADLPSTDNCKSLWLIFHDIKRGDTVHREPLKIITLLHRDSVGSYALQDLKAHVGAQVIYELNGEQVHFLRAPAAYDHRQAYENLLAMTAELLMRKSRAPGCFGTEKGMRTWGDVENGFYEAKRP